ncbi:hypothetical protein C2I36_03675 [Rhodobacteraceae bacterium WD3A24]|nr:hypothetical protein C2I36_03675 [Rhodobacteraceae bacterium WD3A24]
MSHFSPEEHVDWIGYSTEARETISTRLLEHFAATLDGLLAPNPVPPGLFWCLMPAAQPPEALGRDGHPRPGLVLPAPPFPRRMWAGGELVFQRELTPHDTVSRQSTIEDIAFKHGRSGPLGFVTLRHRYRTGGDLAIEERQDIVYRPDPTPDAAPPVPEPAEDWPDAAEVMHLTPDPVLLFRYSALTFNGHRIHYDRDYAMRVEGYEGLVVHGPLQATLMLNLAARLLGRLPARLTFRGVAPLICGRPIQVEARQEDDGTLSTRVRVAGGPATMLGTASP